MEILTETKTMETLVGTCQEILTESKNYSGWGEGVTSRKGVAILHDTIKNMGFGYTHAHFDSTSGWRLTFSMDKPKKKGDEYFVLYGRTLSGGGPKSKVGFLKAKSSLTPFNRNADLSKLDRTSTHLDDWPLEEFSEFAGHARKLARALDLD